MRVYDSSGITTTQASQAGGLGAKTGLYFIDLSMKQSKLTKEARTIQARYHKGYSNRTAETSGVAIPVLTPDRANKRQNGRRFKTNGDPAFTLTGQDRHGIYKDSLLFEIKVIGNIYPSGGENGDVLDVGGISKTLKSGVTDNPNSGGIGSSNSPKIMQDYKIRRLTPTECERLQGFPDNWTDVLSDTQRYKTLGNAVTTNVIKAIFERF